jgi:hypothetical protein
MKKYLDLICDVEKGVVTGSCLAADRIIPLGLDYQYNP